MNTCETTNWVKKLKTYQPPETFLCVLHWSWFPPCPLEVTVNAWMMLWKKCWFYIEVRADIFILLLLRKKARQRKCFAKFLFQVTEEFFNTFPGFLFWLYSWIFWDNISCARHKSSCFYILRYCHTSYLLPIILFFTVKVIKCLIQCDLYFYISVKFCHKN